MNHPAHQFLVDRMLGRLIAWLRIFGYDTKSALDLEPSSDEDTRLIDIAKNERRILVSRDRALIDRAKKAGADAILVGSDDVRDQLEKLIERYRLDADPNMTRCTVCNATLREATKADLEKLKKSSEVPEHLLNDKETLWVCEKCGKAYWRGSHWRNILKTAEEVKNSHKQAE
ncbi:MAG TPA: Mut7-C RNAse domain-containing protein [Methanocella sp.]|uniref:Mut7-C RNAse domain-containing protein n=1 Tax=Methanocella sp. TaxID=2052833 RepID=UPI002BC70603|nr:Mut7-C RNAse domain-containing protein [Methanocella sp.]HTY90851.1 Mut7-C RNAse domain-containing protein [Methanocella sp.]